MFFGRGGDRLGAFLGLHRATLALDGELADLFGALEDFVQRTAGAIELDRDGLAAFDLGLRGFGRAVDSLGDHFDVGLDFAD